MLCDTNTISHIQTIQEMSSLSEKVKYSYVNSNVPDAAFKQHRILSSIYAGTAEASISLSSSWYESFLNIDCTSHNVKGPNVKRVAHF
jgi:hypothetical protein